MNKKNWLLLSFLLVAVSQLYVPAQMVWSREDILESGKTYKFRTAPLDPNDPFRGKFIMLRYEQNSISIRDPKAWETGEEIYVLFKTDPQGFIQVTGISKNKPDSESGFVKANVNYVTEEVGHNKLYIDYPFDRFYMEETLAPEADKAYQESLLDSAKTTFALVKIKAGEAVLKDVIIDRISIADIVKAKPKAQD